MLKTRLRSLSLLVASMLSVSSCSIKEEIKKEVEDATTTAVNALDDAIGALNNASADWQAVLTDTIGKLTDTAQSTIRNELNGLLQRGISATGAEFRCDVDFMRKRVRQELLRIKTNLLGGNMPALEPALCNVVPLAVDMSLEPNRRNVIEFYGYDFDTTPITVRHFKGTFSEEVSSKLTRPTHYHMTLNLGGNGISLGPTSDRIVLSWGGKDISTLAVIQPQTPTCRTKESEQVTLSKMTVLGKKTGNGDSEFSGNGPRVRTNIDVVRSDDRVELRVNFSARETKSDWTSAEANEQRVAFNAPPGWRIEKVNGETSFQHDYTDTDHADDSFDFPGGLVSRVEYVGDQDGNDVGRAQVRITFNRLSLKLVETQNCVSPSAIDQLKKLHFLSDAAMHRLMIAQPLAQPVVPLQP